MFIVLSRRKKKHKKAMNTYKSPEYIRENDGRVTMLHLGL